MWITSFVRRSVLVIMVVAFGACLDASRPPPSTSSATQALVSCNNDCDCGFGAFCTAGSCEPDFGPFFECYCAARDCDAGEICSGGTCTASKRCNNDCDCNYREFCIAGACEYDGFGPPFECYCGYRDCGVDEFCLAGSCTDI